MKIHFYTYLKLIFIFIDFFNALTSEIYLTQKGNLYNNFFFSLKFTAKNNAKLISPFGTIHLLFPLNDMAVLFYRDVCEL